jgi:ATP-dependent protease ClpP protease subunit
MELKEINLKDRIINLFGEIDECTCKETIEKIINLNIKDTDYINNVLAMVSSLGFKVDPNYINLPPITLNLSTFGGDVLSGWGLCDAIRMSDTYVKCIGYGKVMSMGIPIMLSATYKAAHKNTTFMIHDLAGGCFGTVKNAEESVEQLKRLQNQMVDYICTNSKFPKKKLQEIIDKKQDYYFTAEEALKYKIIDEIIDFEQNTEISKNKKQ